MIIINVTADDLYQAMILVSEGNTVEWETEDGQAVLLYPVTTPEGLEFF